MTDEKLFSWYAELELHGILERFPITGQDIDPGYFFASAQAATEQPLLKGSGSKRSGSVRRQNTKLRNTVSSPTAEFAYNAPLLHQGLYPLTAKRVQLCSIAHKGRLSL